MSAQPTSLVVHINGWPGTGKLTIARHLAERLGARLADNHTLINPAEALFARSDPLYRSLRSAVRASVFEHLAMASFKQSFVFTDALSDDVADTRAFEDCAELARERGARFVAVVVDCDVAENLKRLTRAGRSKLHKLTDPDVLLGLRGRHRLLRGSSDQLIEIDVTALGADAAAEAIAARIADPSAVR
ncbi:MULTISPECIES: AAA family ATPase [unclassified Ensifer]|uniref:AAA family ATPase n=1 Tax=unclassified Ensifer TaxID=2633371 RepID=UPI000812D19E|nr:MULTISPECIES: AAA family ATPase [unclassified Ensifer]OCP00282.1 nucleoside kinase [Ensifer sp. LC14]OCP07325.1 nucleoside kinase [Ensifer sp. LC11]OCP08095.1 nucleoside kinase [Ensifer sp. LC13]OCP31931.1 nucleoside kinase [Ensifer sp. LC499]